MCNCVQVFNSLENLLKAIIFFPPFGRCIICVFWRAAVPVPALHTRQARGEDPSLLPEGGELQRQTPPDQAGYITNQYAYQETRNFMQQADSKSVEMG
jgi:hypothetical protein